MLYSYQVYETLLDVARKDLRGRSITPEEFNNVARLVNQTVFDKYYKEFETTQENSEAMSSFKVLNETVAIAGGSGTLPTYFYHAVGKPRYVDTGGVTRRLDMVSSFEDACREDDFLTKATLTHPTFKFGKPDDSSAMKIYVTPATINTIYLDYIRTPYVPYLDYYINDTTLNYTWMAEAAIVNVPAGSTAADGTAGAAAVASLTLNFYWDEGDLPLIINLFLQYLGIQLPSPEVFEGGTILEQKSDQ